MRLFNYLLPLACVAVVGCTSSDVVDDVKESEATRIGFDTHMSKNSRALANDNFKNFFVYGTYTVPTSSQSVQVFHGDLVSKGESGAWTYTNERYWNPQGTYDFYAYSCEGARVETGSTGNANLNGTVFNIVDFTINQGHCNHDLVFARSLGQKRNAHEDGKTPDPVSFEFKHILTRLKFTFVSEIPGEEYTVKISNVKIRNYRDHGTFSGAGDNYPGSWTDVPEQRLVENPTIILSLGTSDGVIQKPNSADKAHPVRTNVETEAVFMIPFAYVRANVRLEFNFDILAPDSNGELKGVLGNTITATWQPNWGMGQSINNKITLSGSATGMDPIRFTGSIVPDTDADADGWVPGTGNANFTFDQSFNNN